MNVGIIGAGTMGSGIAQVAATAGCSVVLYDNSAEARQHGQEKLGALLTRLVDKGRISPGEKQRIRDNITYAGSLKELSHTELVIEAIVENPEVKKAVFSELEPHLGHDAIIASNTSSLPIAA
nr:3-hydroxyacyl-CoA dehydrogenase NAD-binding domain-containing protein [Calditrichia bacterium]